MEEPVCPACGERRGWALNPFGWYCCGCGHQVTIDFEEDPAFNVINRRKV